jgi:hypothetical protein
LSNIISRFARRDEGRLRLIVGQDGESIGVSFDETGS